MEEIQAQIQIALDSIRPYLQEDGGDIEFVAFEEDSGVVELRFLGACRTCPLSVMTLRGGIERVLLTSVKQIKRIESVK
ncbi:MAG: NifU family protein [Candidatus Kapabacteria bacterium]|jgi:Fe-S cluster biogenesis protein NfuA|nr:NifU family protein [Candidatus Kapabacteria bacterium]